MHTKIVLILTLITLFGAFGRSQDGGPDYVRQWCHDVREVLFRAKDTAMKASTFSQEKILLVSGIEQAIFLSRPKQEMFAKLTLEAALTDATLFSGDDEREAEFLNLSVIHAINDLDYIDRYSRDKSDKGPYVTEILENSLLEGQRLPENLREVAIESAAARRSLALIDISDDRRTPGYACARQVLSAGLAEAENPKLSEVNLR